MGNTVIGSVEVSLNEDRDEVVYRLEIQSFHEAHVYSSLTLVELEKGFGFIYAANRHVVFKRFDQFEE